MFWVQCCRDKNSCMHSSFTLCLFSELQLIVSMLLPSQVSGLVCIVWYHSWKESEVTLCYLRREVFSHSKVCIFLEAFQYRQGPCFVPHRNGCRIRSLPTWSNMAGAFVWLVFEILMLLKPVKLRSRPDAIKLKSETQLHVTSSLVLFSLQRRRQHSIMTSFAAFRNILSIFYSTVVEKGFCTSHVFAMYCVALRISLKPPSAVSNIDPRVLCSRSRVQEPQEFTILILSY